MVKADVHVVLTARNADLGTKAVAELQKLGFNDVEFVQLDLDDSTSIDNAAKQLEKRFPEGIDVLVNNAGNFSI